MTNKEWIESRGLSFAEGLKLWDKNKYPDFSNWLKAEHGHKPMFKVGDIVTGRPGSGISVHLIMDIDKDGYKTCWYKYDFDESRNTWDLGCIIFETESMVMKIGERTADSGVIALPPQ